MTSTTATQVVLAGEEHTELLAQFFRAVWDPSAQANEVRVARERDARENPGALGRPAPTFLVLTNGRAVGFVTTIPGRIWSGGREVQAYWLKGLMVLPEFQNGPVGFLLLKEAVRTLDGYLFGMAVAPAARKLFTALRFTDLGPVPNRLAPLASATIAQRVDLEGMNLSGLPRWMLPLHRLGQRVGLARLGGAGLGLVRWAYTSLATWGVRDLTLTVGGVSWEPAELDRTWERMRERVIAGAVRDGAYVRWRYAGQDASEYGFAAVRRGSQLVAVAAIKRPRQTPDPRLKGIAVATLSDLIYDPRDAAAGQAAVAGAERAARAMGAHALLAGATCEPFLRLLRRRAYLPIPGNVHFLMRAPANQVAPGALDQWWVTRGDGESDGF